MTRLIAALAVCGVLVTAALSSAGAGRHEALAGQVVLVDATPNTATNVVNTDHTVTATVTMNSAPLPGATVDFNVTSGPNMGQSASPTTDVNGQATFTYTGAGGVGQDAISACTVILPLACDNVTKDWISPSPTASATATPSPTTAASAAAATTTPTPTFNAPAQLPVTGGGSNGSSGFPWVIVAVSIVSAAAFLGGRLALRRLR
jgi:Bacterial Ig-like domain (group 1)